MLPRNLSALRYGNSVIKVVRLQCNLVFFHLSIPGRLVPSFPSIQCKQLIELMIGGVMQGAMEYWKKILPHDLFAIQEAKQNEEMSNMSVVQETMQFDLQRDKKSRKS